MMSSYMKSVTVSLDEESIQKLQRYVDSKAAENLSHAVRIAIRKLPEIQVAKQ